MEALRSFILSPRQSDHSIQELAAIGRDCMEQQDSLEAGRNVGREFLGAIAENGHSRAERKVAQVARGAAERTFPNSGFQCERLALGCIANGLSGPVSGALASIGADAMTLCMTPEESREVGLKFLKGVQETSDNPVALRLSQVAERIACSGVSFATAKRVEESALRAVAGLGDKAGWEEQDKVLAAFGLMSARTGNFQEDRLIGAVVLGALRDNCEDPSSRLLIETALRSSEQPMSHVGAVQIQREALEGVLNHQ